MAVSTHRSGSPVAPTVPVAPLSPQPAPRTFWEGFIRGQQMRAEVNRLRAETAALEAETARLAAERRALDAAREQRARAEIQDAWRRAVLDTVAKSMKERGHCDAGCRFLLSTLRGKR